MGFEVYGLFDIAEPERVRYVGMSTIGADVRLKGHWKVARSDRKPPVALWMRKREVRSVGMRVLETATDLEQLKMVERFWIAQYRSMGMADLNIADGGNSAAGYVFTEADRAKMSAAQKRRKPVPYNPEWGKRIRAAALARFAAETAEGRRSRALAVAKLDDDAVVEIWYKILAAKRLKDIATEYGVSFQTISNVKRGVTFQHIAPLQGPRIKNTPDRGGEKASNAKLTADSVREIRSACSQGARRKEVAHRFGVSEATICNILSGKSWGSVKQ